nr:hypothetical protein [Planctomycetota bacterium]
KLFFACVPVLLFAACSSSAPYAAYAIEDDAERIAGAWVSDSSLQSVVRVGPARVDRQPAGGELRVVIPVRNIDDESIQVLAQISFRDAQRMPVGDTTNRQIVIIPAGSTVDLEWISRSRETVDYELQLSWNK